MKNNETTKKSSIATTFAPVKKTLVSFWKNNAVAIVFLAIMAINALIMIFGPSINTPVVLDKFGSWLIGLLDMAAICIGLVLLTNHSK